MLGAWFGLSWTRGWRAVAELGYTDDTPTPPEVVQPAPNFGHVVVHRPQCFGSSFVEVALSVGEQHDFCCSCCEHKQRHSSTTSDPMSAKL